MTFISPNGAVLVGTAGSLDQAIVFSENYLDDFLREEHPVGHSHDRETGVTLVGILVGGEAIDPEFYIEVKQETLH